LEEHFTGKCASYICGDGDDHFTGDYSLLEMSLPLTGVDITSCILCYFLPTDRDLPNGGSGTTQPCLKQIPSVLHLHLMRFDPVTLKKNVSSVAFSEKLNLSECVDSQYIGGKDMKYRLHSVLVHIGLCDNGHYFVYTRPDIKGSGDWFLFDDKKVCKVSKEHAINGNFGLECGKQIGKKKVHQSQIPTAYMLIYVLESAIDKLFPNTPMIPAAADNLTAVFTPTRTVHTVTSTSDADVLDISDGAGQEPGAGPIPVTCHAFSGAVVLQQRDVDALISNRTKSIPANMPNYKDVHVHPCVGDSFSYCRVPHLDNTMMPEACLDWFFMALTSLFPNCMHIGSFLLRYNSDFLSNVFPHWITNFRKRRPRAVLFPANLPEDLSKSYDSFNPSHHWLLLVIECEWALRELSNMTLLVLDPITDGKMEHAVTKWFKTVASKFFGFSGAVKHGSVNSLPKLQRGHGNLHCGVYVMALAVNYLFGTIGNMKRRLICNDGDTRDIGLELRKMVAWDSVYDPPQLDACLFMCPLFKGGLQTPKCSPWWRKTHHHDLRLCLNIELESNDPFVMHGMKLSRGNLDRCRGFQYSPSAPIPGKIPTDGPHFFENDEIYVKVYFIGILGHFQKDRISITRAACALQDASATSYKCKNNKWWCRIFGLICQGLASCSVFVCIARHKLRVKSDSVFSQADAETQISEVGAVFYEHSQHEHSNGKYLLHNDGHGRNMGVNRQGVTELFDFERASFCTEQIPPLLFHEYYARSAAYNNLSSNKILMFQVRKSGLDAARSYFTQLYTNESFLQLTFDSDAFEACPAVPFGYVGFWHLMTLLHSEAKKHNDSIPELAITAGNMHIACQIRPKFCREHAASCNIFFNYSSSGQVRITSASLMSGTYGDDFLIAFDRLKSFNKLDHYSVETILDAQRFFDFSLSMKDPKYSSCSSNYSSDEDPSIASKQKGRDEVDSHSLAFKITKFQDNDSEVTSVRDLALNRQFRFLAKVASLPVYENCVASVRQRFPDYQARSLRFKKQEVRRDNKIMLHISHLGSRAIVVSTSEEQGCLDFLNHHMVLSFDTERAYPRFPESGGPISLLQIGTNETVFIIPIAKASSFFLSSLSELLAPKLLVHWGGSDEDDLEFLGQKFRCCDLQAILSPRDKRDKIVKLKGLDTAIQEYLQPCYYLSKEWTMSGFDLDPLNDDQIYYAALDVICCHILYLHFQLNLSIIQRETLKSEFHSFFTPKSTTDFFTPISTRHSKISPTLSFEASTLVRHGLSFEDDFCCHYERDKLIQGFFKHRSSEEIVSVSPKGFRKVSWTEPRHDVTNVITQFASMLNSQRFCCHVCFELKWFQKIRYACTEFKPITGQRLQFAYIRGKKPCTVYVQLPSTILESDGPSCDAFVCLSMLSLFLNLPFEVDDKVVDSVLCDCRYHFISSSLAYFEK
jgi:hypothetical protein